MYTKTILEDGISVITKSIENINIIFMEDPDGTDYQEYLEWVAEGNEPKSATV